MIKLLKILESITSRYYNVSSWLNKNGEFFPVRPETHHVLDAWKYIPQSRKKGKINPIEYLYKIGWQRIAKGGNTLYSCNTFFPPNEKQKQELINLANEFDIYHIEYDNNESYKTIWSKDDILQ